MPKIESITSVTNDPTWRYIPTSPPTGMSTNPQAVWQFDGGANGLSDRTTNGHDLTKFAIANSHTFYQSVYGYVGLGFQGAEIYSAANNSGLVGLTGALTMEAVVSTDGYYPAASCIITTGTEASETEANNIVYRMQCAGSHGRLNYMHESGGGTDRYVYLYVTPIPGVPNYLTITRAGASGAVKLYHNGVLVNSGSVGTAVSGGSTGTFSLGGQLTATNEFFYGVMHSIRLTAAEYSAAQVLETYNYLRGN